MNESRKTKRRANNLPRRAGLAAAAPESESLLADRPRANREEGGACADGGHGARSVAAMAAPAAHSGSAEYLSVKGTLHQQLLDELDRRNLLAASEETLTEFVQTFVDEALRVEDLPLNEDERRRLVGDLLEETLGVGPLASLMADPAVTDILVNRPEQVYVERFGRLEKTDVRFRDVDHLVRIIQRIAARVGRRIDESSPMVDARLPDGSRVNATLPPVTLDSPTLSIRRFGRQRLRRSDLMQLGMFSQDIHDFLDAVVRGRKNVLISGGTGSGKSTMLGALAEAIPDRERIVTVEDSAELILDQEHVVRMETRPANIEGRGLITARDLVVNALRMRPDRIIVGEVRSGEALDMLQAMNTGPRRRHDHGACQQPPRRLRTAGNDGLDGGAGLAVAGDSRADRLGPAPDRPRAAVRGRRSPHGEHRGDRGHGRHDAATAGHLPFRAARPARAADCRRVRRHGHRPPRRGRTARAGNRDSQEHVPEEQTGRTPVGNAG